jgi:hypothetical protein
MAIKAANKVEQAEFLTPAEFGKLFKISRSTVQSMIQANTVQTVKLASADVNARKQIRRIPWSEVERIKATLKNK